MANPQKENGFTPIANEIMEAIQCFQFTQNQFKVLLSLWRNTYGWQRKECEFSLTYIEKTTNLDRKRASATLQSLIEAKVINEIERGSASKTKVVSFNKNYKEWNIKTYKGSGVLTTSGKTTTSGGMTTTTSGRSATTTSGRSATHKINIKESIKKEEERKTDPVIDLLIKNNIVHPAGITATLMDDLNDINNTFGFDNPDEMILEAIKDSVRGNGRTWKFVYNKLNLWRKQGIRKLSDLENYNEHANRSPRRQNENIVDFVKIAEGYKNG